MNHIIEFRNESKLSDQEQTICGFLLEHLSIGVLFFSEIGRLTYCNSTGISFLDISPNEFDCTMPDLFSSEEIEKLEKNEIIRRQTFKKNFEVELIDTSAGQLVLFHDKTDESSLNRQLNESFILNRELQKIFELYADDSIYVTDGSGNTIHVGGAIATNCGLAIEYFKGKNVRELEKKRVFYPSVTLKVLESKQPEVVMQKTRVGKTLVSVGIPVFDDSKKLIKIISVTRDISKQLAIGNLISNIEDIASPSQSSKVFPEFITCHDEFFSIIELIKLVAVVNTTVLICGETGTGKNVAAKLIHKLSPRNQQPYLVLNCGAISPNLIEAELFGYEPGTFTGGLREGKIGLIEAAHKGTLLLDDISELPYEQQVKLLQVLQEKQISRVGGTKAIDVDVRFIATSNKNLETLVNENRFREDLFYRLSVVPISIPPLRQRREDIPLLAKHFLKEYNQQHQKNKEFLKETLNSLSAYEWPGNVRELENLVERLVVTLHKPLIEVEDLPDKILSAFDKSTDLPLRQPEKAVSVNEILPLKTAVEMAERQLIYKALKQYKTATRVAEILGVNQSTISRKIHFYGLNDFIKNALPDNE